MYEDIEKFINDYLTNDEIEIDAEQNEIIHFDTVEALIEYIQN